MDGRDSIAKLTDREKVCLRQWLQHKSAKEIAAELGISHHAVEKRLKMARIKLGATTSLEAARMLRDTEQYGQTVAHSPDLVSAALPRHMGVSRQAVLGAIVMIFTGAIALALLLQPAPSTQVPQAQPVAAPASPTAAAVAAPVAGTEAALRTLVAGVASGAPDYAKLSPPFAEIVRRDLPMTRPLFSSLGELKTITFRERGPRGDDVYRLVFANGEVIMSAALDGEGRMVGGMFQPVATPASARAVPAAGTEAALRTLVAGLASGAPDYAKLSPQFAEIVRRDLPMTHGMFSAFGELQSVTFRERGPRGDDAYSLKFANGEVIMSAALDAQGRIIGGIMRPPEPAAR